MVNCGASLPQSITQCQKGTTDTEMEGKRGAVGGGGLQGTLGDCGYKRSGGIPMDRTILYHDGSDGYLNLHLTEFYTHSNTH